MCNLTSKKAAGRYLTKLPLLALLAMVACPDPGTQNPPQATRVIVHLDGSPANIDSVKVIVSLDGVNSAKNPILFSTLLGNSFFLDFDPPKNQGNVVISVNAYAQQCLLLSGQGQTQIAGEPTVEIHVALVKVTQPTCTLVVSVFGPGHVTSDPAGINCVQQGTQCTYEYPVDAVVALTPTPDVPTSPYSWDGACSGSGMCSVKLSTTMSVTADFSPKVCTQSNWCWENPRPQGNMLTGVWIAPNDQTLFAVGRHGTILIRKGVNWTSSASGTTQNLNKVWGTSSTDVYAVGDQGTILHWGGTGWSSATSQTTQNLFSIHGSSASDVWVTGDNGTVLRGSGVAFAPAVVTGLSSTIQINSVWAFSPNDSWVSYANVTAHWDGTKWTTYTLMTSSFSDVFLFGNTSADILAIDSQGGTHKWNGTSWTMLQRTATNYYTSLWGTGTNTIWAAGSNSSAQGAIWRWDGANWQPQAVPALANLDLRAIHGYNASSIVAVGDAGAILSYDGNNWTNAGGQSVYQQDLYDIWANTLTDLWGAGEGGKAWHGDGVGWTTQDTGTNNSLFGIWGSAIDDVWAVGQLGTIVRWNGQQWSTYPSGTNSDLHDVKGSGPNDVWAVGEQTILHWSGGTSWSAMTPLPVIKGQQASLYINAGNVFVCGQDGIFRWDGSKWNQESSINCNRIHGIALDAVYAIGNSPNSVMSRNTNGQWVSSDDPATRYMQAVYVAAPNDVWLVGGLLGSLTAHWDGTAWTAIDSGLDPIARGIFGIGNKNLWMVGDRGMVLRQRR